MLKFYHCNLCGNLIEMIDDSGQIPVCCGKAMKELQPGTSDGTKEKHVPIIIKERPVAGCSCRGVLVQVGDEPHPMCEEHSILWIALETDQGIYLRLLPTSGKPSTTFYLQPEEKILSVYSYCNLHSLWSYCPK